MAPPKAGPASSEAQAAPEATEPVKLKLMKNEEDTAAGGLKGGQAPVEQHAGLEESSSQAAAGILVVVVAIQIHMADLAKAHSEVPFYEEVSCAIDAQLQVLAGRAFCSEGVRWSLVVDLVKMSWNSKGKGGGKASGKGKGGGKWVWKEDTSKEDAERLKNIDPSQKVWIGGLSSDVNWKTLQQVFNQAGKSIYAATFPRSNTGCVAYRTADEVNTAVTTLNGTWIGDNQIEVDYFTKPTGRTTKGKGKGKGKGKSKDIQKVKLWGGSKSAGKGMTKGKGKGKGKMEIKKLKAIDNSMKAAALGMVWIGNLDGTVTWKMLQD
eukprot:Skav207557  [mRNA]  locus=scaffold3235:101001:110413:- [translate_table: standard]